MEFLQILIYALAYGSIVALALTLDLVVEFIFQQTYEAVCFFECFRFMAKSLNFLGYRNAR